MKSPKEFLDFSRRYTDGMNEPQQSAWGVLFTLLVSSGAAVEDAAKEARKRALAATPEQLAEFTEE